MEANPLNTSSLSISLPLLFTVPLSFPSSFSTLPLSLCMVAAKIWGREQSPGRQTHFKYILLRKCRLWQSYTWRHFSNWFPQTGGWSFMFASTALALYVEISQWLNPSTTATAVAAWTYGYHFLVSSKMPDSRCGGDHSWRLVKRNILILMTFL